MPLIPHAIAAIIAGGRGRRLGGVNKALIRVEGEAILDRQLAVLRPLFAKIIAVAADGAAFESRGVACVPDAITGKGAPGGVYTAVLSAGDTWVFAVACDMPFLEGAAIMRLAEIREMHTAVVPRNAGRLDPLHAFYAPACRGPFETRLRSGDPSLMQLLDGLDVATREALELSPSARFLENVNEPQDLDRIAKLYPSP